MKKLVTVTVLAASLAAAVAPAAEAKGIGPYGAVALGLAGAAVVGSAVAASTGYYGAGPAYVDGGYCYVTRRQFVDPYGYTYSRRVRVCE